MNWHIPSIYHMSDSKKILIRFLSQVDACLCASEIFHEAGTLASVTGKSGVTVSNDRY